MAKLLPVVWLPGVHITDFFIWKTKEQQPNYKVMSSLLSVLSVILFYGVIDHMKQRRALHLNPPLPL
jgi:hypothetical protein